VNEQTAKLLVPSIVIREFKLPEDYPTVFKLWSEAGAGIHLRKSDEPDEIAKKLKRDADLFLLAESEGQVVGSVLGGFDGRRGMVYHLAVAEAFRQRGIGAALMEELEKRLREKDCIRYYLLVTKDNYTAVRFYENLGWKQMDDLFLYAKDID
jgi:ribosomal protein S18 acetylase RimI-like enzyme